MRFLLFFLILQSIYANDFLNSGTWFSEKEIFPKGFSHQSLYLKKSINEDKFILSILSFNETKFWEEIRVNGKILQVNVNEYTLKPEICSTYATKKLGLRWVLLKSVDCDHLELKLFKKENEFVLDSIFAQTEKLNFQRPKATRKETIYVKVVSIDSEIHAWGIEARKLRKNSKAILQKEEILLTEKVDSTIKLDFSEKIKLDSILEIENGKEPSIFD